MLKLFISAMLLLFLLTTGCFDPAKIVITNELAERNIEYIYVSSTSEDEWGINSLPEWKILLPGESHEITVLPDTYDVQIVDDRGYTYTVWDTEIQTEDFVWEVLPSDVDQL